MKMVKCARLSATMTLTACVARHNIGDHQAPLNGGRTRIKTACGDCEVGAKRTREVKGVRQQV